MHRNVENNLRWFFPVVSFSLSLLFQWLPGSLIWSLEPSEDLHCKDVTRAVSLVEWTVISAWLTLVGLWNKTPLFERLRRFGWLEILEITLKYHSIPIYLFRWGGKIFFPQQFYCTPPQKKNNPELLCVNGDCIAALFIGTSITIQGSDFPQAAWKFPRDSQREIPPVVGSYSEQHQAALQKRGRDLAGRLGWTSPGWSTRFVDLLVV